MSDAESDVQEAPIARLTAKERECLRHWLDHKTAKEIALDLGISHHAVEKRLKMARTKLDVATSLEAARILAEAEGYDRPVTGPPDLSPPSDSRKPWQLPTIILGAIAMIFSLVVALALAPENPSADATAIADQNAEIVYEGNSEEIFDELDRDDSGFLELPESPFVTLVFRDRDSAGENATEKAIVFDDLNPGDYMTGTTILGDATDPEHLAEFYEVADADSDGRISFREYYNWHRLQMELGIEFSRVLKIE
jgi:DNA-binding CsgD family transcriptional regulator/Ca2+-binding EF-hand superfamily protein|tara:strand:- start:465 stop:1223 length:759 start_codon:yes stop_codon:yes gene_type:complete